MLRDFQKLQTRSCWLRLSTTICVLSAIGCLSGCATRTVVAPQAEIPQKLLEQELPNSKSWSAEWLKLLQDVETLLNGAQKSTTH